MDEPKLTDTLRLHAKALKLIPRKDTVTFLRRIATEIDYLNARIGADSEESDLRAYLLEAAGLIETLLRDVESGMGDGLVMQYKERVTHFRMVAEDVSTPENETP